MSAEMPSDTINSETEWPELADFMAECEAIGTASPRATILVSAAMIERVVIRLLKQFLIDSPITEKLVGDAPQAPLGTFSARCLAAQALGLITEDEAKCLKIIRDIRNEYAHRLNSNINEESVRSRVKNLCEALPREMVAFALAPPTVAQQFGVAAMFLGTMLMIKIRVVERRRCEPVEKHFTAQGIHFPFLNNRNTSA